MASDESTSPNPTSSDPTSLASTSAPSAPRRGSPATREALLSAARQLFMEQGFDAVTVRAIARQAGVDAAMINHTFGGKEALFQEVTALPVEPGPIIERALAGTSIQGLPGTLVQLILEVWESPETGPGMIALLRRTLADPRQLDLLRSFLVGEMLEPLTAVIAERHPAEAPLRLSLVASQVIGAMTARHVLRLEPLASLPAAALALILERGIAELLLEDLPTPPASDPADETPTEARS